MCTKVASQFLTINHSKVRLKYSFAKSKMADVSGNESFSLRSYVWDYFTCVKLGDEISRICNISTCKKKFNCKTRVMSSLLNHLCNAHPKQWNECDTKMKIEQTRKRKLEKEEITD